MNAVLCYACWRPPMPGQEEQCFVLDMRADGPGRKKYQFCPLCFIAVAERLTAIMSRGGGIRVVDQAIEEVFASWEQGRKKKLGPKDWFPGKKSPTSSARSSPR